MRTIFWVTRPDSSQLAGGQHAVMLEQLRMDGWGISIAPHHSRFLGRERQRRDVLVWTFVPTQLEVWLAKRLARIQIGVIHAAAKPEQTLPTLQYWVTPSEALRQVLIARGVQVTNVAVVHSMPKPELSHIPDLWQTLGIERDSLLIYAGGPANATSGFRTAVWALNILNYLRPNVHLVIHGDGAERDRLELFHRAIDESSRVHFVPPAWPASAILRDVTQVWLPLQIDGVPDALLWALQLGKSIVASQLPSMTQWLCHELNGLLVRPDQPADWAAAANRLFLETELMNSISQAARESFLPSGDFSMILRTVLKQNQTAKYRHTMAA